MTILSMTYHESYGSLPKGLLTLYRRHNVSPSDHDQILATFDKTWQDSDIPWSEVLDFVLASCDNGVFRLPLYL